MQSFARQALALLAPISILLLAAPVLAGGFLDNSTPSNQKQRPEYAPPAALKEVEGEGVDAWKAKLENAVTILREARQNSNTADYNLTRARTRRYPRGEGLQELRDLQARFAKELVEARAALDETIEEARRAGVPSGILADYWDIQEQIEAERAASEDGDD